MNPLSQYRSFRSLLRSQWLDRYEIRSRQDAKLRALVDHAYHHVPYYRELFDSAGLTPDQVRGVDDLRRIPITTKPVLQRLPVDDRVSDDYDLDSLTPEHTSGSTGRPFTSYFDSGFLAIRNGLFLRALHAAGYRFGQRLLLVTAGDKAARPWLRWRYASIEAPAAELVGELNDFRPSVLYGCTTPLRLMAEHIEASNDGGHRPRIVVSTAETLDSDTRTLLRDVFDADVYDIYGLTEIGLVGWECAEHDGYHLSEDTTIVELVRDQVHDADQLVMTNLELRAMPLIRFRTGDLAVPAANDQCRCGRSLRRIDRIEGRLIDCLQRPDGAAVTPYRITLALENIAKLGRYQVQQLDADRCAVRVESDDPNRQALANQVRDALLPVLGSDMRVDVTFVASLAPPPGHKFRIVENRSRG